MFCSLQTTEPLPGSLGIYFPLKKKKNILQKRVRWASAAFLMLSEVYNCFQLLGDLPYKKNVSQLYQEHLRKTQNLLGTEPWKLLTCLITSLTIQQLLSTSDISVSAASLPYCSFPGLLQHCHFVLKRLQHVWASAVFLLPWWQNPKPEERKSEWSCWNVGQGYHGLVLGIKHAIETGDNCLNKSHMWSIKLISCCFLQKSLL